jgi:hypothetical protein
VTGAGLRNGVDATDYWALSSAALCAAALKFWIQYVTLSGGNPLAYKNSLSNTVVDLNTELVNFQNSIETNFWRTDVPEIPAGFHDSFRKKGNMEWPSNRVTNLCLFPVYFGMPYKFPDKRANVVVGMKQFFDKEKQVMPLVPGTGTPNNGHCMGYLLWCLSDINDPMKTDVYTALVNGPLMDAWGTFSEVNYPDNSSNTDDLRSFETGCNISAMARYWKLARDSTVTPVLGSPGRSLLERLTTFFFSQNDGHVIVRTTTENSFATVELINASGVCVARSSGVQTLRLEHPQGKFIPGLYILRVKTGSKSVSQPICVIR